jgi:hypothetical protein
MPRGKRALSDKPSYSGSRVTRLVTVVMSDYYHVLQLVEVRTRVRRAMKVEGSDYRVDATEAERRARERLTEIGKDASKYDFVGVLVAHDDVMHRGRITWAVEVEPRAAVRV